MILFFSILVYVIKYLVNDFNKPELFEIDNLINSIPDKQTIQYFSNGLALPFPFHIEYRNIIKEIENSWIYENKYQNIVNQNHDAPILEREIYNPFKLNYTYTFNHLFLANEFLSEQKKYLENLN